MRPASHQLHILQLIDDVNELLAVNLELLNHYVGIRKALVFLGVTVIAKGYVVFACNKMKLPALVQKMLVISLHCEIIKQNPLIP